MNRRLATEPTPALLAGTLAAATSKRRWDYIRALHHRPEDGVFEAALSWCRSGSAVERVLGADVLGQLGAGGGRPYRDRSMPVLWQLASDIEPGVVESALFALGHLDLAGDVARCQPLLSHPSTGVRHALAFALGGEESGPAIEMLIRLSSDRSAEVRSWATFGLGTQCDVDSPEIRAALLARIGDRHAETRGEALLGLARRSDERAVEPLLRELRAEQVGSLAVEAARDIGAPELLPALKTLASWWDLDRGLLKDAIASCERAGSHLRTAPPPTTTGS